MKKLRLFDSLKFVVAVVACTFMFVSAHAATLPAGYTELEYLQTDGNSWIDTGIKGDMSYKYEIDFQQLDAGSYRNWGVFNQQYYNGGPNMSLTYASVFAVRWTVSGNDSQVINLSSLDSNRHHIIIDNGYITWDGVNKGRSTGHQDNYVFGYNLFLGTINPGGTTPTGNAKSKYYSYKVWNTSGDLIQNFIPARRDSDGVLGMYDLADANPSTAFHTNAGTGTFIAGEYQIKIATTRYNEEQFAPVKTDLSAAVNAVEYVVSNTMSQAQAIDQIANEKQTRPAEGCPRFKKCLLVEDEQGTPHWYEIYDPINDFLNPILAAGNQGAPVMTTHTENGSTLYDTYNGFFNGSGAFRKKYIDNTASAVDRPFGPTTLARCADNATRTTSTVNAGLCYNTGGMFRELTEGSDDESGEWALVWNGNEGGASLGITPGVVYGIAKCTSVGQHTTEIDGDVQSGSDYWWPKKLTAYSGGGTTLASLIEQYPNSNIETVFNTLPNPYGTDNNPEYPRANYRNCWCKMTAIGVPGSGENDEQRYANGTIMSVSGGWVFGNADASATRCAYYCAVNCAYYVRARAAFRKNVLTVR